MKSTKHNGSIEVFEARLKNGGLLNAQDAKDYADGKKQLRTDELYLRKQLTGTTGIIAVINETDVQKTCVTNLSKGSVPVEKNLIIDKLAVRFGFTTANIDAALVAYSNAVWNIGDEDLDAGAVATGASVAARRIPASLQNAEYVLTVDDVILDAGRISDFLTTNIVSDSVDGAHKNFKELEWPIFMLADKRVRFDLKFPDGATALAGYVYIEIVAKGLGLTKRIGL